MAIIIKSLRDTQLSASAGGNAQSDVYQPTLSPVAHTAVVRNIRLANADPDAEIPATVKIECQTGVQSRDTTNPTPPALPPFRKASAIDFVVPPNGIVVLDQEITLDSVDKLQVSLAPPASGTAKLDVIISGIEREV